MLSRNKQKEITNYWAKSAEYDYKTMQSLYKSKRYSASLFFGHLVLEKSIKSLIVDSTQDHAPYTHDLVKLSKNAGLNFSKSTLKLLAEITKFSVSPRYPDEELEFYQQCDKIYTEHYLSKIEILYKKLCQLRRQN